MVLAQKRSRDFTGTKQLLRRHRFSSLSRDSIGWLKEEHFDDFREHNEHLDDVLEDSYEFNRAYTSSIKRVEAKLAQGLEDDSITNLLRSIPGVGEWLSKYIRLEVESLGRFKNMRSFNSWCRVTPGVAQSGDRRVRGRGSKQGNAHMKYALIQAAANAVRLNETVKSYYKAQQDRLRGSGGEMVCLNLIARKLAMAVWHRFNGRAFDEKKLFNVEGPSAEAT